MMKLVRADVKDVETISTIHALSWKVNYQGVVPDDYLDELSEAYWVAAFREWISEGKVKAYLLCEEEQFIGCVSYGSARDLKYVGWGEIVSVYLLPEYTGTGYGQKLLDKALEELKKNHARIYLWVLEENMGARRFYERNGFTAAGDRDSFEIAGRTIYEVRYINSEYE